jgi:CubicO group peptidase (beta-lactamase class C family)
MDFRAWHGRTLAEHDNLVNEAQAAGYGFISLSIYGDTASPRYAAVMTRPMNVWQHHYPALPRDEWRQVFEFEAEQGYGPAMIAATGTASSSLFAAVFEPQQPAAVVEMALSSDPDPYDDGLAASSSSNVERHTIQAMNERAKRQGLILKWAAAYGDSTTPSFAAIWIPNQHRRLWNNDGVLDSCDVYRARLNAQVSGWCRPAFVTLNASGQYLSLFVDGRAGSWQTRQGLTAAQYQSTFDSLTADGYVPVCVQAAGATQESALFTAIFSKDGEPVVKQFSATGPVRHARIDATIREAMEDYSVRHAGLAIVHGKRLVYARGYTLAEPDWPIAQPTTCFRLVSISKTLTAIAIYQLLAEGTLHLQDSVQAILKLQTPEGGPATDPRFNQITIGQLLEHRSGLTSGGKGGFGDSVAVRDAFIAAGHLATLPVSAPMMDSYIASLPLQCSPGAAQMYNNCGYYLLARVVAKLRNQSRPMDAYKRHVLDPLSISRIRCSINLIENQPNDEARYQDHDLTVRPSVVSDDQFLVPNTYGDTDLEAFGRAASGAPTDVARLIAILISQDDNPATKRSTLVSMLSAAAEESARGDDAGHGFDHVEDLGKGWFYAHKLGFTASCCGVLQFRRDWGFIMLWGSGRPRQVPNSWYPDFRPVMSVAESAGWGCEDLFPEFGMPSQ